MSLRDERREYSFGRLTRDSLERQPLDQFRGWMAQALTTGMSDPTAMVLATVDAQGRPSQRTVLLKDADTDGLVFYTNMDSRKGQEMAANPRVSVLFPWLVMDRQVIVSGTVSEVAPAAADTYFDSRPRESQLAAWTSAQSQPVASRAALEAEFASMQARFADQVIPRPARWGGYCLVPDTWEFWQGGANRLHDRFVYSQQQAGAEDWLIERLAP